MKRLTPPILAFYKDAQLAAALDIPHWQVQQACQNGDIQAEFVPERVETKYKDSGGGWTSDIYTKRFSSSYKYPAYWKIPKAEALRLEAELFKSSSENPSTAPVLSGSTIGIDESPEEYAARRKTEGINDYDLAWELFKITKSKEKVGRILQPNPEVSGSAYTKRAGVLLRL
jgi:hypothetical protein